MISNRSVGLVGKFIQINIKRIVKVKAHTNTGAGIGSETASKVIEK